MIDSLVSEAVMARIGAVMVAALMLIVSWRVVGRMAGRFLRFWRALPMLGKVVLPVCLTVFYLHGSIKQTHGLINRSDKNQICSGASDFSSVEDSSIAGTDGVASAMESLRITAFQIDKENSAFGFEASWSENLFDNTLSRNLHLFSSTNLLEKHWLPLGEYLMPSGTNMHSFVVSEEVVIDSARSWFYGLFNQGAFFCFGIDVDSDSDGLTDSCEKLYAHTDPANPDTDGDSILDGVELDHGLNPNVSEASWSDYDGDGLTHSQELDFGSNPLMADSDGDGLSDGVEWRYGWNFNWSGETDEANAPGGMFTTFDRSFTVKLNFENPYPDEATVYDQGEGESFISLDDLVTRDQHKDTASTVTNNIISVETLEPKPIFTTNVTGVLMVKLRCDDYGVLKIGDLAVTNSWPNTDFVKSWKVIEANTTNEVDVTWDSHGGSKWNFEYECYFYPEMPHLTITNNLWIGLDRTGNPDTPYVSSNVFAQAFITPSQIPLENVTWKYSGICDGRLESDNSLILWTTNREAASESYRDQSIEATADGMCASSDFTVVKVDVTIGDVSNEYEEASQGAFVSFAVDGTNSVICNHWTNMLKEVRFSCDPSNLPSNELVRITHNGCGELYEQLPDGSLQLITAVDYPANEISQKCFKLHGHGGSSEFMGERMAIEHLSSGAIDEAPYTVLEIKLVPDYDRNGAIDLIDYFKWAQGRIFRFWINDDEDAKATEGKYAEDPIVDIPGAKTGWGELDGRDPDWSDGLINGHKDLVDFTPVFMDVSSIWILPKEIRENLMFRLRQDDEAVNAVWTALEKSEAGDFQRKDVKCCGRNWNQNSYEATVEKVDSNGIEIPEVLAEEMRISANTNEGVLFVEGRGMSKKPLVLDVYYGVKKIASGGLPTHLSSVADMYWFYSIRGVEDGAEFQMPRGYTPSNLSEDIVDKTIFFTHGFNVDDAAARGWGSEIFKRLWQSGSDARFKMVTWEGNYNWIGDWANGVHYHEDVYQALKSAGAYKELVEREEPAPSKRILMAQSLGNMMTCEALRQGLTAGQYFMLNAAVASEAIDAAYQDDSLETRAKYVPSDWNDYHHMSWAANWHKWFKDNSSDARGKMGWPDYFNGALTNVVNVYNYYSTGDPVFMEDETVPALLTGAFHWNILGLTWPFVDLNITAEAHCWQKQETHKGVEPIAGTLCGGWGFYIWEEEVDGQYRLEKHSYLSASYMVADGTITNNPVFYYPGTQMDNQNASQDDIWLALAKYVPAISSPIGGTDVVSRKIPCYDLNESKYRNGWGRNDNVYQQKWFHSDMKDMAYFYVYLFYDELTTKGLLK